MVLTVEPGLYFQLDDLTVPERYRGIGVRIEDDVVITETGYDNLSAGAARATPTRSRLGPFDVRVGARTLGGPVAGVKIRRGCKPWAPALVKSRVKSYLLVQS